MRALSALLATASIAALAGRASGHGTIPTSNAIVLAPAGSGFFLGVTMNVEVPGVEQAKLESLVAKAHTICPYSKATRGNIEVKLQANGKDVRGA